MTRSSPSRTALNSLSREHPSLEEAVEASYAREMMDDRSFVIIRTADVEQHLANAIADLRFRGMSAAETKDIFVGDGAPLATFSAKIKLGYALFLYERDMKSDLDCLRSIRNAFAHSRKHISFSTKAVADETAKFICLRSAERPDEAYLPLDEPWPPTDPRKRFDEAAMFISLALAERSRLPVYVPRAADKDDG